MARQTADRDDLYAELSSAVPRWELQLTDPQAPRIVAGIRSQERLSLWWGDDCWHFNAENQLKRAFEGELLYRSQGTTLAQLRREQSASRSWLRRTDLSPAELAQFLSRLRERLFSLRNALATGAFETLRSFPPEAAANEVLLARLDALLTDELQLAPPFPGRG